ncbi:pyridoxal phosphate-dependent aminotransferase [Amycolatopsis suaedae]|uniref:Pyridoxal phosphate-dependent aminotransferase n=1 Tax=Amycolatopsis suaedae TaxID=2510978 RepID=A0A4Q7J781_9PSEU|nr:pyridoxal phosphate-dependent aminotransferase [Amycolatopsis suaedae]RZQ63520.1 pyridoxal phosphate-dependent aminotransferase [Amycolatopsis suaedae]
MNAQQNFAALVMDDLLPSRMPDVRLIRDYLADGCPHGDPLCFSFGETWNQVPPGLVAHVDANRPAAHGYQLSMYGLPALRRAILEHVVTGQRVPGAAVPGKDFQVAATWTGTRSAMFDFGRYLLDEDRGDNRQPVVLAAGPSWDYEGVFGALGYQVRYGVLDPADGFRPDAAAFGRLATEIAMSADQKLALVVVNTQHNPTAVNWSPEFTGTLIDLALATGAGLLLDDAYFAVHDPEVEPTSALALLLERLPGAPAAAARRWLCVRSLGKQFHCNGWGIGALVAAPDVLDLLVNRYRLHSGLMYGGVHQEAMAGWLADPASAAFLAVQRVGYADKRRQVDRLFRELLGFPDGVYPGECTSYLMFELPRAYAELPDGCERFRDDCFAETGVLFAPAWPWPYSTGAKPLPAMRMYLGPEPRRIDEGLVRLARAGFRYDMPAR